MSNAFRLSSPVNGSISRINRDIRFSKDKRPYKEHLDLWFWHGDRRSWDLPGFWFSLTPQRVMLGAYLDLSGHTHAQAEALRRRQLGHPYRIDQEFFAWKDSLLVGSPEPEPGQLLMVSWRGTYYRQILDGSQDTWIAEQADRLRRYGKPVLLRWGWEMNGDWFLWGGAANGEARITARPD